MGYLTASVRRVGFFCLAFWLGTVIAFLLNNVGLYKLGKDGSALWISILILGISLGILSCFFYKHIMIIGSGLVGSYSLVRPMGWLAGHYPNEFEIAQ